MPTTINCQDQSVYLSVLAAAPAERVTQFVDDLLSQLPEVEVLQNHTGLAMLPYQDSVQGGAFHLGEVLLAEAHVRVGAQEGYAACLGRNLVQALAIAILDAALQANDQVDVTLRAKLLRFVADEAAQQQATDVELLRQVEATCVELEVF